MKRIVITNACEACGLCFSSSPLIEEGKDGKAVAVRGGYCTNQEAEGLTEAIESCPAHAIRLENEGILGGNKNPDAIMKIFHEQLHNFYKNTPRIRTDFKATDCSFDFSTPYYDTYNYKSYSQAEDAGLKRFRSGYYAQKDSVIRQLLNEYKSSLNFSGMRGYEKTPDNYFFNQEQQISAFLQNFLKELTEIFQKTPAIPENFCCFSCQFGNNDYCISRMIDILDQHISRQIEDYYEYKAYIDTDDTEVYKGRKTIDMYNFNAMPAIKELKKDILFAFNMAVSSDLSDDFEHYWEGYQEEMQKRAQEKEKQLAAALERLR